MRLLNVGLLCAFALCTGMAWSAPVPTTLNDFFLPGSQPGQSGNLEHPDKCDNCHGGYDTAVEPAFNWRGSMMAQAARDPLYYATVTIANQDAPFSGDLCIRCHSPSGWLEGRSLPTDGSSLNNNDREGVQCDFCHKAVKPSPIGTNPYPGNADYTSGTYPRDQIYLGTLSEIPPRSANGMYIADSDNGKRGPFTDAQATHQFYYSPFHSEANVCGTCHDVSNPVFYRDPGGKYLPNDFDSAATSFDPYDMFPVERTFSEWSQSAYNTAEGVYAPQFGGNKDTVRTCQDCHMRDVTGKGCNKAAAFDRSDLPLHDLTGGNTFVPLIIDAAFPGETQAATLDSGIARATRMLQSAASMTLNVTPAGADYTADVRVTNETGHKLPSGYPEGRRIWLHVLATNAAGDTVYESGAYDTTTGILTHDAGLKIYQVKPGISNTLASVVSLPAGPSFHFVLNDTIYSDNRIPPRGFTNAAFESIQSPPVAYSYPDGQYWDDTQYPIPGNAAQLVVTLYYQTTSKEYVEFLRDENKTDNWGTTLYNLWLQNGKSLPVAMATETYQIATPPDADGDGVADAVDNCPNDFNPDQTDDDSDGYGAVCDCDDTNPAINPETVWYEDADSDTYGNPAVTLTQCMQPTGYVLDSTDCDDTDPGINPATVWYEDADSDTYGNPAVTLIQCMQPTGYVLDSTDCDDADPAINPATVWYEDADSDTYGNPAVTLTQCMQPSGYVLDSTDCDDTDPAINPATVWYEDADSDTYGSPAVTLTQCMQPTGYVLDSTDCDDADPAINPATVWYEDADSDTYGNPAVPLTQCMQPTGYVLDSTDCDDANPSVNPATVWYEDADSDTYGNPAVTLTQCMQPSGYVLDSTDCDDTTATVNPGAVEICNGIDDNCNGTIDEGDVFTWYQDADSDNYGNPAVTVDSCAQPAGYVLDNTDCDDTDPGINPSTVWYEDADSDTYGNPAVTLTQCMQPTGYVSDSTDCDDTDPGINPATTWYEDADSDAYGNPAVTLTQCMQPTGYVLDSTDCDDTNPGIHPGTVWYEDADSDTYGNPTITLTQCSQPVGYVLDSTDCDDTDPGINPATVWHEDSDSDGFGHPDVTLVQCTMPPGYVLDGTDNCPTVNNPDQTDTDFDGVGDACDGDCACDCHTDPSCDGVTNVLDVVQAVNIAFKGSSPLLDPNGSCPYETTDADCNGFTNVLDVVRFVNVAFRGGDPSTEFCDPCGP